MPDTQPALPPASTEQKAPQSLIARMLNIFAAPGDVFDSVAGKEPDHMNWLAPAILLLMVSWIGAWMVFSQPAIQQQMREATDKAIDRQVAAQHLPEAQAQQM